MDLDWKLETNSEKREGLQGIYTAMTGETPCATRHLKAVAMNGDIVAQVSWETLGDVYRYAQRKFGDQLEAAGFPRVGY